MEVALEDASGDLVDELLGAGEVVGASRLRSHFDTLVFIYGDGIALAVDINAHPKGIGQRSLPP